MQYLPLLDICEQYLPLVRVCLRDKDSVPPFADVSHRVQRNVVQERKDGHQNFWRKILNLKLEMVESKPDEPRGRFHKPFCVLRPTSTPLKSFSKVRRRVQTVWCRAQTSSLNPPQARAWAHQA